MLPIHHSKSLQMAGSPSAFHLLAATLSLRLNAVPRVFAELSMPFPKKSATAESFGQGRRDLSGLVVARLQHDVVEPPLGVPELLTVAPTVQRAARPAAEERRMPRRIALSHGARLMAYAQGVAPSSIKGCKMSKRTTRCLGEILGTRRSTIHYPGT